MSGTGSLGDSASLAIRVKLRLGLGNRELAELMGISLRTVERMHPGRGLVYPDQLCKLAVAVFPRDLGSEVRVARRVRPW
jgi:hypothetical protein